MKKLLFLTTFISIANITLFAQADKFWSATTQSRVSIVTDKAVSRASFPRDFLLFNLDFPALQGQLKSVVAGRVPVKSTMITLPNAAGKLEPFQVFEASNFDPALQEKFPDIRAFSGKSITDPSAILKLSISPEGIQGMIFRSEKENEFIEAYSKDHSVYAAFKSQRVKGAIPWNCTTQEKELITGLGKKVSLLNVTGRSTGDLKIMRLAQSVTAEYSNYFGATSAAQAGLVLAAVNRTMTRANGVYEKDLALHLNLIANTTQVFYYNPATDPYSPASAGAGGAWNDELQNTLTTVIGEANYDIGHLFGASGGGGNAGCIGCVCEEGKGSGFTSPADAIPEGDNFDIDYVVHEVGHQIGANHTFSHSNELTGVNKEVGSGITIMGYAGITFQDVAPHSIDIFHEASIAQIQENFTTRTCPVTMSITNATPVVAPVPDYTIPRSTPFALTGSATDANANDALTYCWEQDDDAPPVEINANSVASPTKVFGPNFISFRPTTSPTRLFPRLSTILAGGTVSGPEPGGDAGANTEALSTISRTLNFRLTVRDNAPYRSTAPASVGQTQFTDMTVTVDVAAGPFTVNRPNTGVTYTGGSTRTITWAVANTNVAPVNTPNVKISLSTDGGQTFPHVLAESTPNDSTEQVLMPNISTSTARVKIEAIGNIFFDISDANFSIIPSCNLPEVIYVDSSRAMSGNGSSWANAFNKLDQALRLANLCINVKQVWVKKGTYYPDASSRDSSFIITRSGVELYGGFGGNDTTFASRKPNTYPTILSGELGNNTDAGDNSYHVLLLVAAANRTIDTSTVIDGFTITGGNANSPFNFSAGNQTLTHNNGAGIYSFGKGSGNICTPKIIGCTFKNNRAERSGGSIFNDGTSGGNSSPRISNSEFYGNSAGYSSNGNTDVVGGAAVFNNGAQGASNPTITNCTFFGNDAKNGTGGAVNNNGAVSSIANSILFGNATSDGINNIANNNGGSANVVYSIIEGGYAGTGNLNVNPLFVDAAAGNLQLQQCSPAINAGDSTRIPAGITTDITGGSRIFNATVDMGAFECRLLPTLFTFKGTGVWSNAKNWQCNWIPTSPLPSVSEVIIDPVTGNSTQDIPFTVGPGGKITIATGKQLVVPANVTIQ
jgi:hypothetical protein